MNIFRITPLGLIFLGGAVIASAQYNVTILPPPAGFPDDANTVAIPMAINNKGQITGAAYTTNSALHAFITTGGKLKDLGVISGSASWGFAINDSGIVVGQSTYGQGGNYHAFVYNGRKMVDLNKLIPANSGWELYVANGVNDAGRIIGYGTRNGTTLQAFLLTPR